MSKYEVIVKRTDVGYTSLEVEATDENHAYRKARDQACNAEFDMVTIGYEGQEAKLMEAAYYPLPSTNGCIEMHSGNVYPTRGDGSPELSMGIHITDQDQDWWYHLTAWDYKVVEEVCRKHKISTQPRFRHLSERDYFLSYTKGMVYRTITEAENNDNGTTLTNISKEFFEELTTWEQATIEEIAINLNMDIKHLA